MNDKAIDFAPLYQKYIKTMQTGGVFQFSTGTTLGDIVVGLIPYIYTLAGIILLFYLITGGYQYIVSAGDPKKVQAAKSRLNSAFIGFILVFISYWIIAGIGIILDNQEIQTIFQ